MQTSFGIFTSLTQATYLDEFLFQQTLFDPVLDLAGRTTNEGASDEGYYKWKADTRLDWAWKGFDLNGTLRYIDGFDEQKTDAMGDILIPHYVKQTFTLDLQASYEFSYKDENQPVSNYSKDGKNSERISSLSGSSSLSGWQRALNGLRITVGCNNVFDRDPPQAFGEGGNAVGYPSFTYDATGRFVYVRVTKKF